jgi:hypothetical protein
MKLLILIAILSIIALVALYDKNKTIDNNFKREVEKMNRELNS